MNSSIVCIILIFFAFRVSAESNWITQWEKFKNLQSLSAKYSQLKHVSALDLKLKSKGSLSLEVSKFFVWEIHSSKKVKYLFDNKGVQFFEDEKKVREISNDQMGAGMLTPIQSLRAWLCLDKKFILDHYNIKTEGKNLFKFIPKDENELFSSILIKVGEQVPLKEITLNEKSGDSMHLIFEETKIKYAK